MRVNSPRGLATLASFGPKIRKSVEARPDGLLLHENLLFSLFPPHAGMRQYWRDFDSLERWARSLPHQQWWQQFLRDRGGTGFWHETYFRGGQIESVYIDMPRDRPGQVRPGHARPRLAVLSPPSPGDAGRKRTAAGHRRRRAVSAVKPRRDRIAGESATLHRRRPLASTSSARTPLNRFRMASALRLAAAHTAPHLNRCNRPGRGGDRITDHQPAASTSPGSGDSAVDRWAGLVTPRTVDLATRATTNQLTSHPLRAGREYWGGAGYVR